MHRALDAVDNLATSAFNIFTVTDASIALELSAEAVDHIASRNEWLSGAPLHSGLVRRRSTLALRWGRCPCLAMLRPRSLAVYPAEDARRPGPQPPSVIIPVDDMEMVTAVADGAADAWPRWEVRTHDQVLHRFAAPDVGARDAWVEAIVPLISQADARKGLDGAPPMTAPGAVA